MTFFKPRDPTHPDKSTEIEISTEIEKSIKIEKSMESAVEGEIREFIRRDAATLRPEANSELVANNIGSLLQRVAGSSIAEIDRVISELQTMREVLQSSGARVEHQIAEYARLSQSAVQSTKIISESLAKSRNIARAGGG